MTTNVKKLQQLVAEWMHRAEVAEAKAATMRSDKWSTVKRAHLKIQPDCQACGTTECVEVHHIKDFRHFPQDELKPTNLITLCESKGRMCHLHVGHCPRGDTKPSWKKINPFVREDAAIALAKVKK